MLFRMVRRTALIAAFLAVVLSSASMADVAEITLKIHHFLPTTSVTHAKLLMPWAERIEAQSNRRIKVVLYPAMQLGGTATQLYDQVRDGVVDGVWTLPGYTAGRFPIMEVFELPFMVGSAEATSQAAWEFYTHHAQQEFGDVHPILVHVHGPGSFHMRDRRVRTMTDLAGAKIRAPSRVINQALEALGAVPVGMPVPQVPQALSRGVVDGAMLPFEVAFALKVPDLVKFHARVGGDRGIYTAVFLFALNKARYDSLPPDLKAVIDANSGLPLAKEIGHMWDQAEFPGMARARELGNTIDEIAPEEVARWKVVTRPVVDAWVGDMDSLGLDGKALLEEAGALVEKYSH